MPYPAYTLVIATRDRCEDLEKVFRCLAEQTHPPTTVVVVDGSTDDRTQAICNAAEWGEVRWEKAEVLSAAQQRNQGARELATPLVVFCDDDITFPPEHFARLTAPFAETDRDPPVVGTAGRMEGSTHPQPGHWLHRYYRWQAGYDDPHYGARLFGPGINTFPCFEAHPSSEPIASEWLNSGCVVFRSDLFTQEQFPDFDGYSYLEDVHLSARIGRYGTLYFLPDAAYEHHEQDGPAKRNVTLLMRMYLRNQRIVAREVMGLPRRVIWRKQLVHRVFISIALFRQRPSRWWRRLWGAWTG